MSAETKRVVVVGAGVIGLSTAWYLTRRGHQVTVVDRRAADQGGCSFGNAGMLVPSHIVPLAAPGMVSLGLRMMAQPRSPFYIKPRASLDLLRWMLRFRSSCTRSHVESSAPLLRDLHFRSRQCYVELEQELPGGFGLVERGLLMLCKTQKMLDEEAETADFAESLEVPAKVLDRDATAELDPDIEMDVAGSVFYPRDCHLSPNRLMASLQSELNRQGCEFVWGADAEDFTVEGDRVRSVRTNGSEIDADEFVLCSGIWSSAIAGRLNLRIPMQAGKGYSMTVENPVQLPKLCSLLGEARVAVTPIGESLRFGGTMEMAGIDSSITKTRVQGIKDAIPKYFPRFSASDLDGLEVWSGLRPCSPDGMPYLGRSAAWRNLVVSTGHAMMGISLALVSGEVVADLVSSQPSQVRELHRLSPDRYGTRVATRS